MDATRIGTLQWVTGVYCAVLGALILVAPHQFRTPDFAGIQQHLPWWGDAILLAGICLLTVPVLRPARALRAAAQVVAGTALLTLAAAFAAAGGWIEAPGNAMLGVGLILAGLVAGWNRGQASVFGLLMGLSALLTGLAMFVVLAMPAAPGLPHWSGAAGYEPIRAALPWYEIGFLGGGLALVAALLHSRAPPVVRAAAHALAAGAFLAFAVATALPGRLWADVAYFGTFGVLLALLPWLGPRLDQVDPASLRTRLALALAGVAALPLILAMALLTDRQLQVARTQALAQQQTLAAALAQVVADYVGLHQAAVAALAAHPGLAGLTPEAQRPLLRAVGANFPDLVSLGTLDASGRPLARGDDGPLAALPGRSLYEAHRTSAPSVMVVAAPGAAGPMLILGAPILDSNGAFGGLATGAVESARLATLLARAGAGVGGRAYLVDTRTGFVLAHPGASLAAPFADLSGTPPVAALLAAAGASGAVRYQVDGDERLAGYASVPNLEWGVVVEVPQATALASALAARDLAFGVLLLSITCAALAGVAIAASLAAPLRRLARAADQLATGTLVGPIPQSPITEVAHLAAAFQDMRDRLAARDAERERAEEARLHLMQEQAARQAERRRADQAERLVATLAQVAAAPDLERALEALLRGAIALLGGDEGVARLFGPHPGERPLELVIDREGRLTTRTNPRPQRLGSYAAALQAGGPPVLVHDFWALDPAGYPSYATMKQQGMRAAVNVPLDAGGQRIGSLHVNHHEAGGFGPADLALAEALAAQAGAAIERARLEAAQREAVAAREEALRQLAQQTEATARREAEAAALRELDRLKDELLATVSHELRTPLTVVQGYAESLQARAHSLEPGAVATRAARILTGARQLARLVEDLLSFARMQRGEVPVQPADFDLAPVLEQLAAGFRSQAGGERLTWDLPAGLIVHADEARVAQAVSNLVENALKYAPGGHITLRAAPVDGMVRVDVEDEGPGIPFEEQARVWEKFFRGSGVAGLNVARGSGIGLAVVKAAVEAQGGRVGLDSKPGWGSRFWFDLPAAPVGAAGAAGGPDDHGSAKQSEPAARPAPSPG